jgi:uncharacterized RDD family membrane protein YckC/DNA-directed RNA polymerase subunit RPC12/RpoP
MSAVSPSFQTDMNPVVAMPGPAPEPVMMEFRCTHCWYSNLAECEASGTKIPCRNCGDETLVPEPSKDRIARAEALLKDVVPTEKRSTPTPVIKKELTDKEIVALAAKESFVPLNQMDFSGLHSAAVTSRVLASLTDSALLFVTSFFGIMLVAMMSKLGYVEVDPDQPLSSIFVMPAMFGFTIMLVVGQYYLICTQGQTIGKKLFMIRIVTTGGRLPGFLQGILLRNWLRFLLSFIPFFGIIDLFFVLGESRRCIHDLIAGTRVVDAF